MRFLLDENLSYRVCAHLKAAGHDAVHVSEIGLAGVDDELIVARALADGLVIVSCDHDFVQLLFASGDSRPSLLHTREVDTLSASEIASLLVSALSPHLEELLEGGAIATLTLNSVRARRLPLRRP